MGDLESQGHILNQIGHSQIEGLELKFKLAILFAQPFHSLLIVGKLRELIASLGLIFHRSMGTRGGGNVMLSEGMGGRSGFFLEGRIEGMLGAG
jgi:hypothetical protein